MHNKELTIYLALDTIGKEEIYVKLAYDFETIIVVSEQKFLELE